MNFSTLWTTIKTVAVSVETKVATAVSAIVTDTDKVAPLIEGITGAISPSAESAEKAVVAILDAVETAIGNAHAAAVQGVTITLPAQLVSDFNAAKTAIEADLASLGIKL